MKFLRKTATFFITIVFIAAFAIGIGVIFSVKNVNVTLLSYEYGKNSEGATQKISELKSKILGDCRGNVITFVDENDVLAYVDDGYVLDSFEKIYPCTINITVRQRMDTFAVSNNDGYTIYDEDGKFLFNSEEAVNSIDNAPDIIVEGLESADDISIISSVGAIFKSRFNSLRSSVEKIVLERAPALVQNARDRISFVLRCGITIEIQDYPNFTSEKIGEAYREFSSLTGEQKLTGKIYCYEKDGTVTRTYDPNA